MQRNDTHDVDRLHTSRPATWRHHVVAPAAPRRTELSTVAAAPIVAEPAGCAIIAAMGWSKVLRHCSEVAGPVLLPDLARVSGLSPRTLRSRIAREGWWQPFPDVVGAPGLAVDDHAWAWAAALHARGRSGDPDRDVAAVTRWSALALLGVRRSFPTRTEIAIPAVRWLRERSRLAVVRSRLLSSEDVRDHDGVPMVSGSALLRDLAPVTDPDALRAVAIDILQRRDTSLGDLERILGEHARFPGRPNLRQVVCDLASAGRTDSPFEFEARQRFAGDGVPLDRGQVVVPLRDGGRIHMDLGIAAIRLGIEAESLAWHASRDQLDRDAMRANAITAVTDDWRVFRLTWTIMRERWSEFVAEVRETIAAQSQRHLGVPWPRPGDLRT